MDAKEKCELLKGRWRGNACVIDEEILDKAGVSEKYQLFGPTVVTDWYGNKGYSVFLIETNKEGYEKIRENPLQDYISFGVKSVDYASFKPVRIRTLEIRDELPPIEKGEVTKEDEDFIEELISQGIIDVIRY